MTSKSIRLMELKDIDDVLIIERACFPTPWSRNAFETEIEGNACSRYVVAVDSGRVIGYGGMWLILDEAHVTNVAVHPARRGEGYGEAILRELIRLAKELGRDAITLEVRFSNTIAQNLYRKLGFNGVGLRKGYYSDDGEDALIMWKDGLLNDEVV